MLLILWFLAVLTLIFGLTPFVMTFQFWRYTKNQFDKNMPLIYTPKVALIIPCKGTDLNFEANIKSFICQDYPNYETIFVTATVEDPAHSVIAGILNLTKNRSPARLLVAGIEPGRGQKMTNMIKGIQSISPDTEVLAFMDADILTYKGLLRNLINPLQQPNVGAASGFPIFLPVGNKFGSLLKFIWGIGAILTMPNKRNNLASGAINCIKKDTFNRAGIEKLLKNTVSDTMAITKGVRSLGLSIQFVPEALVISTDKSNLKEALSWTNRLTIFTRAYNPAFWWLIAISYCFANLMILTGCITLIATKFGTNPKLILPASLMVGLIGLQMLHAFLTFPVIVKVLTNYPSAQDIFKKLRWRICFIAPLGGILILINSLNSLTTNIVTWRGVRYRLKSATETEVLGESIHLV